MKCAMMLLAAFLLGCAAKGVVAQGDKTPDIKEIMGTLNKPTGLYYSLGSDLKDDMPDWDEMQPKAKKIAKLAAALGKDKPPKGDEKSWAKMTKEYAANAAALEKAVAAKDKATAKVAFDKMGGATCMNCHKAHRPD
jgi:hypothetical protein